MTNKELADCLEKCTLVLRSEDVDMIDKAIDRLRSLPDPTPEPVKDLRWLVERHECLSSRLSYSLDLFKADGLGWLLDFNGRNESGCRIPEGVALTVVRGIVHGMCDRYFTNAVEGVRYGYQKHAVAGYVVVVDGKKTYNPGWCLYQAIDALLTAMEGKS